MRTRMAIPGIVLASLLGSFALAAKDPGFELIADETVEIDVAGPAEVVLLFTVEQSRLADTVPSAEVVDTYGGFECEIGTIELKQSTAEDAETQKNTYQLPVHWEPGADSSGCLVEVKLGERRAKALLFMSF